MTRIPSGRFRASTRYRDVDGRLRRVTATGSNARSATSLLKGRLVDRRGYGSGGMLALSSPFRDLVELWLADLGSRELATNTKENYRADLRRHVLPVFEHYTLGEITTGRVERFLKAEAGVSYSRAKHSRNLLNQIFSFALRHDALPRNPLEGTSPLVRPKTQVRALTLEQVQAIRAAAAAWRREPGRRGPKPDDKVRDVVEVLAGTGMRPGEVLGLRPVDIAEGRNGMVVHVRGSVIYQPGHGSFRQDHPKTDASVRRVPVAEFAAAVIRRRLAAMEPRPGRADDLRQQDRGSAQRVQRSAHLPGVPRTGRAGGDTASRRGGIGGPAPPCWPVVWASTPLPRTWGTPPP